MAGKPSKRTPEREQRVLDALRAGNTIQHACRYADISDDTFMRWRAHSAQFAQALKRAEAEAIVRNVAIIQQAARDGTWQAAAWWLERRYPADYGRHFDPEVAAMAAVQVTVAFDRPDANQNTTTLELPAAD